MSESCSFVRCHRVLTLRGLMCGCNCKSRSMLQVLAAAEARERKLGALEVAQGARQAALEASYATQLSNAQAAVKRFQAWPCSPVPAVATTAVAQLPSSPSSFALAVKQQTQSPPSPSSQLNAYWPWLRC